MSGIAVEDLLVHLAQCRARVRTQLFDESFAHRAEGLERVCLSATTELGQHQLPGQAFVERMVRGHRGELRQQLAVATSSQACVVAVKGHCKPLGLQRGADIVQPRGVERGERDTPPHRQRLLEQRIRLDRIRRRARLAGQLAEAVQIDRQRIGGQHIAAGLAGDLHIVARNHLPEPG